MLAIPAAVILFFTPVRASAQGPAASFQDAVNLYQSGLYEKARTVFESLGDPMSRAYAVLCAIKADDADYARLYAEYNDEFPESVLGNRIRYEYASSLFAKEDYAAAAAMFSQVSETRLDPSDLLNLNFRRGYCAYANGRYDDAVYYLLKVESAPKSSLTSTIWDILLTTEGSSTWQRSGSALSSRMSASVLWLNTISSNAVSTRKTTTTSWTMARR